MLAFASRQPPLELAAVTAAADRHGVQLIVRTAWPAFVQEVGFWTLADVGKLGRNAITCVDARLIQMDVRNETLAQWRRANEAGAA